RSCSNTSRTARSRTSGEYFFACLMTPISQELESPANPGRFSEHLEPLLELACGLGLFQAGDEVGERAVVDAPAALGCGNGETDGQVGLADAGRAEEDHVLLALHKAQLVQALDLLAPD